MNHTIGVNTILHTRDGRKIGNAIVTRHNNTDFYIKTDYGNEVLLTMEEINDMFYIAWVDLSEETDGTNCNDMQLMMSEDHKHRVKL